MFARVTSCIAGRQILTDSINNPDKLSLLQFVRWRKRRWAPIAKSKIYYVRKPTPVIAEEDEELRVRYNHYRTCMRGIKDYIKAEHRVAEAASRPGSNMEEEELLLAQLLEKNDIWNKDSAKFREARESKLQEELEEKRLADILRVEEEEKQRKEMAERQVVKEMELSKQFISIDRLEEEIEKALNMRVNYNFAIDPEGNRYIELPDGSTTVETKESKPVQIYADPDESVKSKDVPST